jgi:integrase/recombinase XerC
LHRFWQWQLSHRAISSPTELRRADLQAFQQAQLAAGVTPRAINRHLDEVLALLRYLVDQDQALDPALFRLKSLAQGDRLPRYLPEADIQRLESYVLKRLASAEPLIRLENACFFTLAHTGLRASECLDLQLQDLDLPGGRLLIRQAKGLKDRVVYLSETAQLALSLYLGPDQPPPSRPLFVYPNGQPIGYNWLILHLASLGRAAGNIQVTPHQLRHTLATRLINLGMKETRIQKLLGHQHLATTMIYARVLDPTVEADYQRAMRQIEQQQPPLATAPELMTNWPVPQTAQPVAQMAPTQDDLMTLFNLS